MNRCIATPEAPRPQDSKATSPQAESASAANLALFPHRLAPKRSFRAASDREVERTSSISKMAALLSGVRPDVAAISQPGTAGMFDGKPIRLIGMSGSLRTGSYSNAVLATLRETFAGRADLELYDLAPIPLYNQDFEGDKQS